MYMYCSDDTDVAGGGVAEDSKLDVLEGIERYCVWIAVKIHDPSQEVRQLDWLGTP